MYNGAGQRTKKITQTETRIFHYDLQGHLISETNQTGQILAEYIYLGDQLLATVRAGEVVYYCHNDHLGTPQALTDDSQAVAWKAIYTPFGNAVTSVAAVDNPFRFPGQYYDSETGLHYNHFRYYNPQTGRYITPDPIGLEGGMNLFAYVQNNPLNRIDMFGQMENVTTWGAIGIGAEETAKTIGYGISGTVGAIAIGVVVAFWPTSLTEDDSPEAVERQREYEQARDLSNTRPPQGRNPCSNLSRQIDHAEKVIKLYEAWDAKWNPGCHNQKIQDWKQRLKNLKDEHRRRCTHK